MKCPPTGILDCPLSQAFAIRGAPAGEVGDSPASRVGMDGPEMGTIFSMTTTPTEEPGPHGEPEDDEKTKEGLGVEVGMTEGEGSTFEPEEDPEGHQ